MSKTTPHFLRRTVLISLCCALLLTLILAPGVGAASDTNKTETKIESNDNIVSAEDALLTQRAITIDEAKKEAQEVVSAQLALIKAKAATEAPTEVEELEVVTSTTESYTASSDYTDDSSSSSSDEYYTETNTATAPGSGNYLLAIDNPDPGYVGYSVALNDEDRALTERILMGEAGGEGYIGMALIAQCIRDTYVTGNYSSMAQLLKQNGYYGSTSIAPSSTAKEVVSYIFDQGGSAVQHKIRVFYASNMCTSAWHEAQQFVCQYNYVRFFDC